MLLFSKAPKLGDARIRHKFALLPKSVTHSTDKSCFFPKIWLEWVYVKEIYRTLKIDFTNVDTWDLQERGPIRLCPHCNPKNTDISRDDFHKLCSDPKLTLTDLQIKELKKNV